MPIMLPPDDCYYDIFPESTADRFDPDVDWHETIETTAPGDTHLSTDGAANAILHGWIPYNKVRNFALYCLGYAAAENKSPWRLRRVNPPTHPLFPFLRVRGVTIRGFEPRRDNGVTTTEAPPAPPSPANPYPWFPYATGTRRPGAQDRTPVEEFHTWEGVQDHPSVSMAPRQWSMRPRLNGESFGYGPATAPDRGFYPFAYTTGRYEKAKVVVEFSQPNWPILEDTDPNFDPADESGRNVFWTTEPTLDVLAVENNQGNGLFWREGRDVNASTVPRRAMNIGTGVSPPEATSALDVTPALSGFKSALGYLEPKLMDVANWMHVPTRFIFDANLIPTKILECLGKINSTAWYGYDPGTVLLMGASFQSVPWPIYSTSNYTVWLWNVKYHFKYYNPKRRPDGELTPNPAGAGKQGWNLFRYQDGFAYYATRFNGDDLYESVEMRKLFEHREKP